MLKKELFMTLVKDGKADFVEFCSRKERRCSTINTIKKSGDL